MANGAFGTLAPVYGYEQGLDASGIALLFSIAAIGIRHWFNIRHLPKTVPGYNRWVLPLSLLLMLGLMVSTLPPGGKGAMMRIGPLGQAGA